MLKLLLHPPASEEDDIVKKHQVQTLSSHLPSRQSVSPHSLTLSQLRELAMMNGTYKEHPSDRARMHGAVGRGQASILGQGGGHEWAGGGGYADPAMQAYNRVS